MRIARRLKPDKTEEQQAEEEMVGRKEKDIRKAGSSDASRRSFLSVFMNNLKTIFLLIAGMSPICSRHHTVPEPAPLSTLFSFNSVKQELILPFL